MNENKAVNTLTVTKNEAVRRTFDCSQWIKPWAKLTGITSISVSPSGGPSISAAGISLDGKSLSFLVDATGVSPREYLITAILSSLVDGETETLEARGALRVLS